MAHTGTPDATGDEHVMLNSQGDIVRDLSRNQIAKVTAADAETKLLTLSRPSGYSWQAEDHHCRPASERDLNEWAVVLKMIDSAKRTGLAL